MSMFDNIGKGVKSLAASVAVVAIVASSVWLGVVIGRGTEHRRMQMAMELQAKNDGTTNVTKREYARDMAALEQYMAGHA